MSKFLYKNILVYGRKQSWLEYLGGLVACSVYFAAWWWVL